MSFIPILLQAIVFILSLCWMKTHFSIQRQTREQVKRNSTVPLPLYRNKVIKEKGQVWICSSFVPFVLWKNLAIDPSVKDDIKLDLEEFRERSGNFKNAKDMNNCYLFYGPTGTGKSSAIAAIAYLMGYKIYCIDLYIVKNLENMTELLKSATNLSLFVFEDVKAEDAGQLTWILNCIGQLRDTREMLFVFSTKNKSICDMLTPSMHKVVKLTPCCPRAFTILTEQNKLVIEASQMDIIKNLLQQSPVTIAEVVRILERTNEPLNARLTELTCILLERLFD